MSPEKPLRQGPDLEALMETRRRQYLTSPGEPLLLPLKAMAIADRRARWSIYSKLDSDSIISSPLLAIAIVKREPGTRWDATAEPAAFWNPLLWLPDRLASPAEDESTDVWAIRVALELTISGLYDVETGTRLDVLSAVGPASEKPLE